MRSTWSADRLLRLLATASLEAGWLTLIYLAVQWLAHSEQLTLGIGELGLAVIGGVLLVRSIDSRSPAVHAVVLLMAAVVVGVLGIWLSVAPATSRADLVAGLRANPGGVLLGVALLRGAAHGDLDRSASRAERLLDAGLLGLVGYWLFAGASGLSGSEPFSATAYAATLTIVSASLLSLGLARLTELRVEGVDRAARWRWLVLLIAVIAVVLAVGAPLAAVLGVPVAAALEGVAGPLAPVLLVLSAVIVIPLGLIAELIHLLLPWSTGVTPPDLGPLPSQGLGSAQPGQGLVSPMGLDWTLWPLLIGLALLGAILYRGMLRRSLRDDDLEPGEEIREGEPLDEIPLPHLPRLRLPWRRRRARVPATAEEAYRLALPLLVGRPEERRAGETPREHARRVVPMPLGPSVARLAADYQLNVFAERTLTPAEERRALERWRRVERASRSAPRPGEGGERSG